MQLLGALAQHDRADHEREDHLALQHDRGEAGGQAEVHRGEEQAELAGAHEQADSRDDAPRGIRSGHEEHERHGDEGEAQRHEHERQGVAQAEVDGHEVDAPDEGDEEAEQEVSRGHDSSQAGDRIQHQFRMLRLITYDHYMIDLQGLRALVAVDRAGSVVAAADQLGYTPSAVSQQVKKLERDLDAVLLERRGRGVLLTERGRTLASEGRELLDGLERLEAVAASGTRPTAPLRIASFSTATRGLLGPVLGELREADAAVLATVTSVDPVDAMAMVASGSADLAVVHNWNSVPLIAPSHVATEHVCHDEADVVLSIDHPLAGRAELERADLVGEAWASTPKGAICHEALMRIFADLGTVPRVVAEDPDFASLIELARQGVAIALVPRLGRSTLPDGVVARPLADHSQVRDIRVAYRRSMAESAGIRRAVRLLLDAGRRIEASAIT